MGTCKSLLNAFGLQKLVPMSCAVAWRVIELLDMVVCPRAVQHSCFICTLHPVHLHWLKTRWFKSASVSCVKHLALAPQSFLHLMSCRNLLGLLQRRSTFPVGLETESGIQCIDPGGGGWFGRVAGQSLLTGLQQAKQDGRLVHVATLVDFCHVKHSELARHVQTHKGSRAQGAQRRRRRWIQCRTHGASRRARSVSFTRGISKCLGYKCPDLAGEAHDVVSACTQAAFVERPLDYCDCQMKSGWARREELSNGVDAPFGWKGGRPCRPCAVQEPANHKRTL